MNKNLLSYATLKKNARLNSVEESLLRNTVYACAKHCYFNI